VLIIIPTELHRAQAPTLAIGFDNGRVQLMTSETDEKPILIDTGLRTQSDRPGLYGMPVLWNSNGSVLAVSGVSSKKGPDGVKEVSQVQFYDWTGHHLRTLKVPGNGVSGIAWEGGGLRLALAVDSFIYFANIRPDYKWSFFSSTLVYAYNKHDRTDHSVVFFDTSTGQKHVKYVKKLMSIKVRKLGAQARDLGGLGQKHVKYVEKLMSIKARQFHQISVVWGPKQSRVFVRIYSPGAIPFHLVRRLLGTTAYYRLVLMIPTCIFSSSATRLVLRSTPSISAWSPSTLP
jgi:hypothetical protein